MDKNEIDRADQDQRDILVVDDNPASLQLLKDILNKAGYHVRPAPNGTIALRSVEFKLPDLILLDVKMPDIDGYEVCRRLKSNEKNRDIPVIFISGLGETTQKVQGFTAGGVDYITKPFETEEVLARVNTHLRLRELTGRLEEKVTQRTEELTNTNTKLQQEITLRKEAERNITLLNFAINNVQEETFLIDENGRFHYVNEESCRILGYSRAELLDMGVTDIDPDFPLIRWAGHWNELMMKHLMTFEGRHKTRDGRIIPVEINSNYFEFDNQSYIMALVHDITERKQAEEALRTSEESFRVIVENSPIIIFLLDRDGVFTLSQGSGLKKLGLAPGEVVGKSIFEAYAHNPQMIQHFNRAIAGEAFIALDEEAGIVFETRWTPIKGEDEKVKRIVGVSVDVTERKHAEDALRESEGQLKVLNEVLKNTIEELAAANKELESFSYSVAHDLRNPLKTISGFTDFLIEDYAERLDEEGKDYLDKIKNGTKRMNSIIEDILALSKVSRQQIEIVDLDLSEMARLVINELFSTTTNRKVKVKIQEGLKVRADARLMSVTLGNLLGNAWKYTEKMEHPEIEFGSFEKDGQRIFYVKDNGVGFDMSQAGRLFVPFQRLHSEKEFKGTGVGLAIVELAIKRHGGKIWAEGEVGKGAIFYFTLRE